MEPKEMEARIAELEGLLSAAQATIAARDNTLQTERAQHAAEMAQVPGIKASLLLLQTKLDAALQLCADHDKEIADVLKAKEAASEAALAAHNVQKAELAKQLKEARDELKAERMPKAAKLREKQQAEARGLAEKHKAELLASVKE